MVRSARPDRPRTLHDVWREFRANLLFPPGMTEDDVLGVYLCGASGMLELILEVIMKDPENGPVYLQSYNDEIREFMRQHDAQKLL